MPDDQPRLLKQFEGRITGSGLAYEVIAGTDSQSDLPFRNTLGVYLPLSQIFPGKTALLGILEIFTEALRCPGVGLAQPVGVYILDLSRFGVRAIGCFPSYFCSPLFLEFYPRPLGQPFYSLRKRQILTHLDEFEHVSAGTAGEALEYLLDAADVHARAMVSVKRAQTHHFAALFLQTHVLADHVNDIVGLLNLKDFSIVKHPCHTHQVPSKTAALRRTSHKPACCKHPYR